ncbi:uncharacterized protein LOC129584365 [Paramacrobiotus metropolitanus]|uniref:uncharacterized protein LOC129584365 n=1 Tax=Paramacrobiotus metropolitanus TaxID=2943436 RepID=UPI002445C9A3|nr:uncharacterized protein LOC129584365 [Paramacrobiotus metropolitanus]
MEFEHVGHFGNSSYKFTTLVTTVSPTMQSFGISLALWKFYLIWCILALPSFVYVTIIQALVFLCGYVLRSGQSKFLEQLRKVSVGDGRQEVMKKLQVLLDFHKVLFDLAEIISHAFGWIAGIAYYVDAVAVLTYTATTNILSGNPLWIEFFGMAYFFTTMVTFPFPFLEIDQTDCISETELCMLSREAPPLCSWPEGFDLKLLLDAMLLSQQKLKLQIKAVGSFNLTWSLIVKTVAWIASISVIANELMPKDDNIQQQLRNCSFPIT